MFGPWLTWMTVVAENKTMDMEGLLYYILLIRSSTVGHLGYFYTLAIINYAAMNIHYHFAPFLRYMTVLS